MCPAAVILAEVEAIVGFAGVISFFDKPESIADKL
jgi:hypothetical protein